VGVGEESSAADGKCDGEVEDKEGEGDDNLEDATDNEASAGVEEPGGGFGHFARRGLKVGV